MFFMNKCKKHVMIDKNITWTNVLPDWIFCKMTFTVSKNVILQTTLNAFLQKDNSFLIKIQHYYNKVIK